MKRALLWLAVSCGFIVLLSAAGQSVWRSSLSPRSDFVASSPLATPRPLQYAGSLGYWWEQEGLASLKEHITKLDVVTLYWYAAAADGTVALGEEISPASEITALALAREHQKEIILGVNNFETAALLDTLLENTAVQERQVGQLVALAQEKGYDGVAIDFENLRADQTDLFTAYLRRLGEFLHAADLLLVVTVPAQREGHVWDGIDVSQVARVVDRVELQTYEEHGDGTEAGPVASLDWVEALIVHALIQGIPAEKIFFGVTFSGNDWLTAQQDGAIVREFSTREALVQQRRLVADLTWDAPAAATFYTYDDTKGSHTVWLEDARSTVAKIERLQRYNLGGIFLWFLGGEDPAVWESIPQTPIPTAVQ